MTKPLEGAGGREREVAGSVGAPGHEHDSQIDAEVLVPMCRG